MNYLKSFFSLSLFMCILLCSCETTTDTPPKYSSIDSVTGMSLYDATGADLGTWREPNDYHPNISAFPNPANGNITVSGVTNITRIMVIPANCFRDTETENIPELSVSSAYDIEDIEEFEVLDLEFTSATDLIFLDLSDRSEGFYRVFFIENSETIYRQNIYIDPDMGNVVDVTAIDNACP